MFRDCYRLWSISHFCNLAEAAYIGKSIKYFCTAEKVMPYQIFSNGSTDGCFLAYASFGGIKPLTGTIFDPTYFGVILRNHISHIFPTRLKNSIMGTTLTSVIKWRTGAQRLSQGQVEQPQESAVLHLLP